MKRDNKFKLNVGRIYQHVDPLVRLGVQRIGKVLAYSTWALAISAPKKGGVEGRRGEGKPNLDQQSSLLSRETMRQSNNPEEVVF